MKVQLAAAMLSGCLCAGAWAQGTALSGDAPAVKVGDTWRWERADKRTGVKDRDTMRVITSVAADRIEANENEGVAVFTRDMAQIESADWVRTPAPRFYDWPIAVGKKWDFKYAHKGKTNRSNSRWEYSAEVVAVEKVKVPAGEFDAFKVVYKAFWNNDNSSRTGGATQTNWYAPAARTTVKTEYEESGGSSNSSSINQLMELKLQP